MTGQSLNIKLSGQKILSINGWTRHNKGSGMKSERKWQSQSSPAVRQEADRLGLIQESWEIVKLIPSVPLVSFENIDVGGTVACHQCGKALPFSKSFTWGMLGASALSCPDCNVEITVGAYDMETGGIQPLWIYAAPFTERNTPTHRNLMTIQTVDGFSTVSGGTPPQAGNRPEAKILSDQGVACAMRNDIQGARDKWIAAAKADPTWSVPYFNIAKSFIDAHSYQEAESYLNQAEERAKSGGSSEDSQVLEQVNTIRARIVLQKVMQRRRPVR